MTKYDDASWHLDGEFPEDLPPEAAAIPAGMFLGWAIQQGLAGELLREEFSEELTRFNNQEMSAAEILRECLDGKLISDDLAPEAAEFADVYYQDGHYYHDFEAALVPEEMPSLFHPADNRENFAKIQSRIQERFLEWKRTRKIISQ